MRHRSLARTTDAEPYFEMPPQLSARPERRLTARALAGGVDGRCEHEFRANAVTLMPGADIAVVAVGDVVAATFGLGTGGLPPPVEGTLARLLRDACAVLRVAPGSLPFEGVVATPRAACVMLRGVLLPLADGARVEAVLSWKAVLDDDATARLRAELLATLRRAGPSTTASDVFRRDPATTGPTVARLAAVTRAPHKARGP